MALHPWDEETFGFRTGEIELGEGRDEGDALVRWMSEEEIVLLSASVHAEDRSRQHHLHSLGFLPVEESYTVAMPRLARAELPTSPVRLRLAENRDQGALKALSRRAFRFGRFFTDPLFPPRLARERMAAWVGRALSSRDPGDVVLVMESPDRPSGFFHVRIRGGRAQLQLGAVDPERNEGLGGVGLFVETLRWLRGRDVRSVTAEIAAANTAVVNIYAALGFHFTRLDITMHLHSPHAPYLRG
ncbi:MAG: hypothetical protein HKO53_20300 [Gemmatimonadetes bacterium]|nr:hypothetical protein [Gemmatimonadota bacterium]